MDKVELRLLRRFTQTLLETFQRVLRDDHVQVCRRVAVEIVVIPQHAVADAVLFEQSEEMRDKSFPDVSRCHLASLNRS